MIAAARVDIDPASNSSSSLWFSVALTASYAIGFLSVWATLRIMIAPAAFLPVLWAAYSLGTRGALLTALACAATHYSILLGEPLSQPGVVEMLSGNVLLVTLGVAIGALRDRIGAQLAHQRESEERYEIAARGANDGLWDWNLKTDEVFYSAPFAELLDYSPKEIGNSPEEWFGRVHPDDLPFVREGIRNHLAGASERYEQEHRMRRKDGSWLWVLSRGIATHDDDGTPRRMTGWITDIAERKRSEDQLRHHAFHDPLTGLPNRALFMDRLAHALARSRRNSAHRFAILVLDLDRFKVINDSLGHVAGDELLVAVASRLETCLRPGDTVARMGGDEFMLLLEDVEAPENAMVVAGRIYEALSAPLPLAGHDVVVLASIGIALGDRSVTRPHDLLRDADTAMYEAKTRRHGRPVLFDVSMHDRAVQRLELETALRQAIERHEMYLVYQPIIELETGSIAGFEALLRWRHPTLGLIAPLTFVPLAEETGLIGEIGFWVLVEAIQCGKRWQELFPRVPPLRMSVNLSVRQMQYNPDLLSRIDQALDGVGLLPESLCLEITESVILDDTETGAYLMEELRARGIRVCMDDFGTGYSSLSYLHKFRVDSLKIDMSFVRALTDPTGRTEVARTILTLARSLGLSAVAEGVETEAQLARLRELGCPEAQGYFIAPPLDVPSAEALLRQNKRW
jgi:diguanylate cyclase (GGDEF)-like protein/PAS domain S-box-containing protein